jgi:hypothetical protein
MAPAGGDGQSCFFIPSGFFDRTLLLGPFRAGLMAASVCLNYEIEKVKVFLAALAGFPTGHIPAAVERARRLSIADCDIGKVMREVEDVIRASAQMSGGWDCDWI